MAGTRFQDEIGRRRLRQEHGDSGNIQRRRKLLETDLLFGADRVRWQATDEIRQYRDLMDGRDGRELQGVMDQTLLEQFEAVSLRPRTVGVGAPEDRPAVFIQKCPIDLAPANGGGNSLDRRCMNGRRGKVESLHVRLLMLKNSAPSFPLLFRPFRPPREPLSYRARPAYRASFTAAQSSNGRGVCRRSFSPGRR